MKPRAIIAVDVDDVCADMLGRLCRDHNERNSLRGTDALLPENLSGWDINPYFGEGWQQRLTENLFYDRVLPVEGARTGVHSLLGLGYRVIYVTSCVPGTADAKQRWLLKWGFLSEKNAMRDFFAVSDKSLVKADALFDDAVHNVEAFDGPAFLVEHWHNRNTPCSNPRITGLFDAPRVLGLLGM